MEELYGLLRNGPEDNYTSPIWNDIDLDQFTRGQITSIITKHWLIGFMEAEGSFYITRKGENRYVHGMGITQKKDRQI